MDCVCFEPDSWRDDFDRTFVGVDRTNDRFGEVAIDKCRRCGSLWLHYFVEYASQPDSGRWYRGRVSSEVAAAVTPDNAVALLDRLPWRLRGGAFFGRRGERTSAPVQADRS